MSLVSRDIGISEHLLALEIRVPRMLFEVSWGRRACSLHWSWGERLPAEPRQRGQCLSPWSFGISEVFFRGQYHSDVHELYGRWAHCAQRRRERLDCSELLLPTLAACSMSVLEDIQALNILEDSFTAPQNHYPARTTIPQWQCVSFGETLTFTKFPRTLSKSKIVLCVSSSHSFRIFIPGKMFAFAIFN